MLAQLQHPSALAPGLHLLMHRPKSVCLQLTMDIHIFDRRCDLIGNRSC